MEQPESEERATVTVSAPSKHKAQSKAEEDDDNIFLDHYINGTDMPVRKSTSTNTAMAWAMMANMQRIYRTRGFDFLCSYWSRHRDSLNTAELEALDEKALSMGAFWRESSNMFIRKGDM